MNEGTISNVVRLVDGRLVSTWSEDWRHECEARHILSLQPLQRRRDYLNGTLNEWNRLSGGILQRRGPEAVARLQATMSAIWKQRAAEAKAQALGRTTPANQGTVNDERKAA